MDEENMVTYFQWSQARNSYPIYIKVTTDDSGVVLGVEVKDKSGENMWVSRTIEEIGYDPDSDEDSEQLLDDSPEMRYARGVRLVIRDQKIDQGYVMNIEEMIEERRYTDEMRALDIVKGLDKGDTIYGIVKSVSASGMSRRIKFYTIKDNRPVFLTWSIGQLLGYKMKEDGTIRVDGVGMDMIFKVVYDLGYVVHNDGYFFRSDSL